MIQRVFFDLGLTLAESDGPSHYVEYLAQPVSYTHLDVYKRQPQRDQLPAGWATH